MEPFRVSVSDEAVADLRERLARTRWPDQLPEAGWDYGSELRYMQSLCTYWREEYDWQGYAARLNAHPHFVTDVDGLRMHFYHLPSPEPGARPLVLTHGWPGSVVEFLDVMAPLSDPRAHGGDPADAFHVVVVSLPGFGYSGPTTGPDVDGHRIAPAIHALMLQLGYDRYFAQGGDWGSLITTLLGALFPDHVAAIHLNMLTAPPPDPEHPAAGLSEAELADLEHNKRFSAAETGYQQIQRTKPQTLAYGLTDSPAALAAWIVEKFRGWSDCGGDVERSFSRDRLLDNIALYWLTGTINASMRLYREHTGPGRFRAAPPVRVPVGHARYPAEIIRTPRAWAEARLDIRYWREMPRGGHFAAMEVPDLFVSDLRDFFRAYR